MIWLDIIGIIAFTISGYLIAKRHNLDILGVFIVSFFTALGGGFIRDLSVNEIPFIFKETYPLITVLLTIFIFSFISKYSTKPTLKNILFISDSLGLITFSMSGAMIAINHNLNITGVILLAFLTAAGGGIIRDIFVNTVPFVFVEDFYGSVAIIIAIIMYFVGSFNLTSLTIIFFFGLLIRLLAVKYNIKLPKLKED
jgi:uncharacterized membrane protein YeiH